jgi:hypothetical protein
VRKCDLGLVAICVPMMSVVACSPTPPPNFIAIDPAKQSDTWALQRADIDCKAQVRSEKWFDHLRLRHRVDPIYVSCMQQKGYVRPQVGATAEVVPSATTSSPANPISLKPPAEGQR